MAFISMIKVDGMPIPIPPVITPEDQILIAQWRRQAVAVEEKLNRQTQSHQRARLQSSKIGAVPAPARSANFEERPQSRNVSEEPVVRKALTSAAYRNQKTHIALADMLHNVALNDSENTTTSDTSPEDSVEELAKQAEVLTIPESTNSAAQRNSSSTDLEKYLSRSSEESTTEESSGTVRPETLSAEVIEPAQQSQEIGLKVVSRESYTIETPSNALLQQNLNATLQQEISPTTKLQFGHLGSMVARYLTEQQRAKNISEFEKLQSLLQENSPGASESSKPSEETSLSAENSPSKLPLSAESAVAGVKRRRQISSKSQASATDRLAALVRGHLVRKVLRTQKLQHWIQTIRDCRKLLVPESPVDWRSLTDTRFREQLVSQLSAALEEFHNIMFTWPLSERLALIQQDSMPRSAHGRPSAAVGTSPARSRPIAGSSKLAGRRAEKNVFDVTKRRRLTAASSPRTPSSISNRVGPTRVINRPATSAESRSPRGVASRVSRPSTAAPSTLGKQPVPPQVSPSTSRRSVVISSRK